MIRLVLMLLAVAMHLAPRFVALPGASLVQRFTGYRGSRLRPNIVVWHTTEGGSWPTYDGGATAPHLTVMVDVKRRVLYLRQHYSLDESARALRNLAGGVNTNTANAVQIELIGTCDRRTADRYGLFYWPDAPDWVLRELAAKIAGPLHELFPDYPLRDAAPRGWVAYPRSYANGAGQRMSMAEWRVATGNVGHQHVPENVHGDPGDFPMARLLEFARPDEPNPAPGKGKPEPKQPTKVTKARGLLRDAMKDARGNGAAERARKIKAALKSAPTR